MNHTIHTGDAGTRKLSDYAIYGLIFLGSLFIYVMTHQRGIFMDCDSPWHIATGDHIRMSGGVPETDPWTFLSGDARWFNIAWLYDVWVSWWHEKAGLRGLVAVNIVMTALIPCILAKICLMRGCSYSATFVSCLVFYVILSSGVAVMRPQQVSLLLAVLSLLALSAYREKLSAYLWVLPVIAMIWANVHGAFLVIFTLIGAFFLEALYKKDWRRVKGYVAVGMVCGLSVMMNPAGHEIFYGTLRSMGSVAKPFITEWQPANFKTSKNIYGGILILAALTVATRKKWPLADTVIVLAWIGLALSSIRYAFFFTLFSAPVIAILLTAMFKKMDGLFVGMDRKFEHLFSKAKPAGLVLAVSSLAALLLLLPISRNLVISDNLYDPSKFPVTEIDYLIENHPDERVFNYYNYGGYIIFQSRGTVQHFMDGRVDTAFPREAVEEFIEIDDFPSEWEKLLAQHSVNLVIFPKNDLETAKTMQDAQWDVLFSGEVANIYQRPATQTKLSEL